MTTDKVIILQDDMSQEGLRSLHVMSAEPLDQAHLRQWDCPYQLSVKMSQDEIRLYHLTATWLAREAMYFNFKKWGDDRLRPVAVWALEPGQRISDAAVDAALVFAGTFGFWPSAAWVRIWPKDLAIEDAYIPISWEYGIDLFAVKWVPEGFVVVGGGFNQRG